MNDKGSMGEADNSTVATIASIPPPKAATNLAASPSTPAAPTTSGSSAGAGAGVNRNEQQIMRKLKEANLKYKDLLKLAKERIQAQDEEMENLKKELKQLKEENSNEGRRDSNDLTNGSSSNGVASSIQSYEYDLPNTNLDSFGDQGSCSVVKVYQRIKLDRGDATNDQFYKKSENHHDVSDQNDSEKMEIWAFIEYEINIHDEGQFVNPTMRFSRWRRFRSENAFADHIRVDLGEPIHVPPYSLSPKQSQIVEDEARQAVIHITEEFRRFRVRAEVARKQADATVRALQSNNVQNARKHIEGQDIASELAQARSDHEQLAALKAEMTEQEAHWKSAYDVLLAENNQLKSSRSEALLAAQWRQRYESCISEKEKLEIALALEREKTGNSLLMKNKEDSGKYEAKYKDLKESFRLYRKKAKEIFEAQQKGEVTMLNLADNGADEAKISYLRNLMVNYLSSDPTVRDHMEGAIGTVLKFSDEDRKKIEKQKKLTDSSSWFG